MNDDRGYSTPLEFEPERFFDTFVGVAKGLLLRPQEFFRQLPRTKSLKNPVAFLAVCAFLTALLAANFYGGDSRLFAMLLFAGFVSSLLHSIILHLFVAKKFRSDAPFGATFRLVAYVSLTDIVSWIPLVGFFFKIYGLYLLYLGLKEQHGLTHRQSVLALMFMICVISALALGLIMASPESLSQALRMLDPQHEPGTP